MDDADRKRIIGALEREGLLVTEWFDEADASYPEHAHATEEVRVVLDGSMTLVIAEVAHELGPGDRVDIAASQPHSASVGPHGVRYLAGSRR
jgi:quercetin dioxygenase-like cupin family protein